MDPKLGISVDVAGCLLALPVTKEELLSAADEVIFEETDNDSKHTIGVEEHDKYKVRLDHDYCLKKDNPCMLTKDKRTLLTQLSGSNFESLSCPTRKHVQDIFTKNHTMRNSDQSFLCEWDNCGELFSQKQHLSEHVRIHIEDRPFACSWGYCKETFSKKYNLNEHERKHTRTRKQNLKAHVTIANIGETCEWKSCGKTFTSKQYLSMHLRKHLVEHPVGGSTVVKNQILKDSLTKPI